MGTNPKQRPPKQQLRIFDNSILCTESTLLLQVSIKAVVRLRERVLASPLDHFNLFVVFIEDLPFWLHHCDVHK